MAGHQGQSGHRAPVTSRSRQSPAPPGVPQRPRLPYPHRQIQLLRIPHRPMQLQRRPRRRVRRFARHDLRRRHIGSRARRPFGERRRSPVQQRAGELQADQRVRQPMLDRLERSDRHPELGALLHVRDRGPQQRLARPERLRRRGERRPVRRRAGRLHHPRPRGEHLPAGLDPEQPPRRIGRSTERAVSGREPQLVPGHREHRVHGVRVQRERPAVEQERRGHRPRRHPGQPLLRHRTAHPAQQYPRRHRLHHRPRHRVPPQLQEGHREFHRKRSDTLVRLRYREREHPRLREPRPQGPPRSVVPGTPRPDGCGRIRGRQHRVQRAGEIPLLVVEEESHQRRPFGRPSSRSAMMSRWISFVPA